MMKELSDGELLELLEMYMEMNDKKDEIISRMGELLYRQQLELANYRNIARQEEDL